MRRMTASIGLAALGASLLLAAPAQAGGFCGDVPAGEERGTTVKMGEDCFFPTVLRAPSGATVTWLNSDPHHHTVTGVGFWSDRHKEIASGERLAIEFERDGIYVYSCLLHPGMTGAIVVGDPAGLGPADATEPVAGEVPVLPATPTVDEAPVPAPSGAGMPVVGAVVGVVGAGIGFELGRRRRR